MRLFEKPLLNSLNKKLKIEQEINDKIDALKKLRKENKENKFYKNFISADPHRKVAKRGMLTRVKELFFPFQKLHVKMCLRNGNYKYFVADIGKGYFFFKKGVYVVDADLAEWNETVKMYFLEYHQDIAFPLMRRYNIDSLKSNLEQMRFDLKLAINPYIMNDFVKTQFVQKVVKGADISKDLGFLRLVSLASAIASVLTFLLVLSMRV